MPDVSSGPAAPRSRRATGPGAGPGGGLPKPLTSFIGRERELAQARQLLQDSYLVTLTGPGGSGKTRLCIALATEVAAEYHDGSTSSRWHRSGTRSWWRRRSPRPSACRIPETGP
jgi:hypothetical protein